MSPFDGRLRFINTRHVFTIISLVVYILLVIFTVLLSGENDLDNPLIVLTQYFATSPWIPITGLILAYIIKINRVSLGKVKKYSIPLLVAYVLLLLGILGATGFMCRIFGLWFRVFADLLQCTSLVLIAAFSLEISSWNELDWKDSIHSLHVIYKGGIFAFSYEFKEGNSNQGANAQDPMMTAGAIETTQLILDAVISTGDLKTLDFQDKKLILERGGVRDRGYAGGLGTRFLAFPHREIHYSI